MQELLSPQSLRDDSPRAARADVTMHGSSGATSSQSVVAGSSPAAPVELEEAGVAAATEQPSVWRTDDHVTSEPVADPVIGPQVAAARRSLRLSVDELGERTRVRPHVIEAIEVDDFSACGGDVYARGHLRVLARVLGIDADRGVLAQGAMADVLVVDEHLRLQRVMRSGAWLAAPEA